MFENKVNIFLTFGGNCEEACKFYENTFPDANLLSIIHYADNSIGLEGKVLNGVLQINNQQFIVMDIQKEHSAPFTFAFSILYSCKTIEKYDEIFKTLSEDGMIMMEEDDFQTQEIVLKKCCWVTDKFGLTWQLIVK